MKHSFKTSGIIAVIAMIVFSMVSCETFSGIFGSSKESEAEAQPAAQPAVQQTETQPAPVVVQQEGPAVQQAPPAPVVPWPTNQPSIIGTWRADFGDGYFSQYVFIANGTGRTESHSGTRNFRWTVRGNAVTIEDEWGVGDKMFNIEGNTITFGSPGYEYNEVYTRR